jgi:ABC-type branched-subunit amino acid transport system substrate-binding protein
VKKAGTLEPAQVAEAIRGLAEIQTPMGKLSYVADGDLRDQKIYIFQVQNGDWVQVFP